MSDTTGSFPRVRFAQEEWTFQELVAEHQRQLDAACQTILGVLAEGWDGSLLKSAASTRVLSHGSRVLCAPDVSLEQDCIVPPNSGRPSMPKESGPLRPSSVSCKSRFSRYSVVSRQTEASAASQRTFMQESFTVAPRAHRASMLTFDKDLSLESENSLATTNSCRNSTARRFRSTFHLSSNVDKRASHLKTHVKAVFARGVWTNAETQQSLKTGSNDSLEVESNMVNSASAASEHGAGTMSAASSSFGMRGTRDSGLMLDRMRTTSSPSTCSDRRRVFDIIPAVPEKFLAQATHVQSVFEKLVNSPVFDAFCALVIVSFMVMLGYDTHMSSQNAGERYHNFLTWMHAFNVWFTLELLLRIAAEGKDFFWESADARLNLMDTCLVLTSVADLIFVIVTGGESSVDDSLGVSRAARVIRILRALRAVRLARVMQHVMHFRKMVYLIQGSITTLFWCLLLVFLLIYTFAVLFTQGVTDHLYANDATEELSIYDQKLKKYYGSVPRSICSLFQSMATGINWGVVFEPMLNMGWGYSVLFIVFISFSMFGVLNVLTSVFVESTVQIALTHRDIIQHEHEKQMGIAIKHLREVFLSIDYRGEGRMKKSEMTFFLQDPYVHAYLEALDINLHDSESLFKLLDSEGCGEIDVDEFCRGCLKLKGHAKSFDLHCLISEVARYLDKWSQFTDYAVSKFSDVETLLETVIRQSIEWEVEQHDEVVRCKKKEVNGGRVQPQQLMPSGHFPPVSL